MMQTRIVLVVLISSGICFYLLQSAFILSGRANISQVYFARPTSRKSQVPYRHISPTIYLVCACHCKPATHGSFCPLLRILGFLTKVYNHSRNSMGILEFRIAPYINSSPETLVKGDTPQTSPDMKQSLLYVCFRSCRQFFRRTVRIVNRCLHSGCLHKQRWPSIKHCQLWLYINI